MFIVVAPVPDDLAKVIAPYRRKYDPLADVIPPHISLLSPFEFSDPPELLYNHLVEVGQLHTPIRVSIAGWDIYSQIDHQIRLPLITGKKEFVRLRDHLLQGPLEYCAGQDKDYWPHVPLGKFLEKDQVEIAKRDLQGFEPQFIFRVTHMEVYQWDKPGRPWKLKKRVGLVATLAGSSRKK